MAQGFHTISAEPFQSTLITRVFGSTPSPDLRGKLERSNRDLTACVERMFLHDASSDAALQKSKLVEKAGSLVSFSENKSEMQRWELSADVKVIRTDSSQQPGVVEADLHGLARDFGACIAIPLLYGQDFLDRNPEVLNDLWKFDNNAFPLLMIGFPTWTPLKLFKEGVEARTRIADNLTGLYQRVDQYQKNEPIDFGVHLSDVGRPVFGRSEIYNREEYTIRQRGEGDVGLLWGQNANTQPMLFWLLTYVYSTPGLLQRIRDEIAPHMVRSQAFPGKLVSLDLASLTRECQLLKSCLFETYRLANEATSIRYVARPVIVKDGSYQHEIKPGTYISVPHALKQQDPSVYSEPEKFVPERFLETDSKNGRTVARYGVLKPWGVGPAMCKGRTFAEKELMALSAAIVSLWDLSPANASGEWEVPAMMPGTGVKKPAKDIRVKIMRRAVE